MADTSATADGHPVAPGLPLSSVLPIEERALIAAVLGRDRKATARFVSAYADAVYSYVHQRVLPHTDVADDLVQDVFLAAWQHLAEFRGESSVRSWLLGIARHKVQDYYRTRLSEPEILPDDDSWELPAAMQVAPRWDDHLDQQMLADQTRRILATLPEASRLVLLWRYWEACSTREIASRTGKTDKSIERLLARAREQFKRRWNDE